MHGSTHVTSCQLKNHAVFKYGIGRIIGENTEHLWAELKAVAKSLRCVNMSNVCAACKNVAACPRDDSVLLRYHSTTAVVYSATHGLLVYVRGPPHVSSWHQTRNQAEVLVHDSVHSLGCLSSILIGKGIRPLAHTVVVKLCPSIDAV